MDANHFDPFKLFQRNGWVIFVKGFQQICPQLLPTTPYRFCVMDHNSNCQILTRKGSILEEIKSGLPVPIPIICTLIPSPIPACSVRRSHLFNLTFLWPALRPGKNLPELSGSWVACHNPPSNSWLAGSRGRTITYHPASWPVRKLGSVSWPPARLPYLSRSCSFG